MQYLFEEVTSNAPVRLKSLLTLLCFAHFFQLVRQMVCTKLAIVAILLLVHQPSVDIGNIFSGDHFRRCQSPF